MQDKDLDLHASGLGRLRAQELLNCCSSELPDQKTLYPPTPNLFHSLQDGDSDCSMTARWESIATQIERKPDVATRTLSVPLWGTLYQLIDPGQSASVQDSLGMKSRRRRKKKGFATQRTGEKNRHPGRGGQWNNIRFFSTI